MKVIVTLFGTTAKECKRNPKPTEEVNIRDYTDLLHSVILSNLENINAELIEMAGAQPKRLIKLNNIDKNKSLKNLEYIGNKDSNKLLIDTKKKETETKLFIKFCFSPLSITLVETSI